MGEREGRGLILNELERSRGSRVLLWM